MCPIVKWFYESDRSVIVVPNPSCVCLNRTDRGTKRIAEKNYRFKLFTAFEAFLWFRRMYKMKF